MTAIFSKLTLKSQIILRRILEALDTQLGGRVVFRTVGRNVSPGIAGSQDSNYRRSVEATLPEWKSSEDAAAYDKLGW